MWRARPRSPSCQPRDRPRNQKCWPNFPAEPRDHQQSIEHPLELARSRSFRSDDRSSRQRVPLIAGASSRPSHSPACRPRKTVSTPLFLSPRKSILDRAGREGAPAERRLPHIKVRFFYTRRSVIVVLFSACGSHGASPRQRASRRATLGSNILPFLRRPKFTVYATQLQPLSTPPARLGLYCLPKHCAQRTAHQIIV